MDDRAFTTAYDGLSDRLINEVYVDRPYTNESDKPQNPKNKYKALWDTGATNSVITERVARECLLINSGMSQMSTAGGLRDCKTFFASILLPNRVFFSHVKVTDGDLIEGIDVLIGMDIISQGDFAVTNYKGITRFSFQMPSKAPIDFVQRIDRKGKKRNVHKKTRKRRNR